jgi:hypothetical protein
MESDDILCHNRHGDDPISEEFHVLSKIVHLFSLNNLSLNQFGVASGQATSSTLVVFFCLISSPRTIRNDLESILVSCIYFALLISFIASVYWVVLCPSNR